MASEAPEQPDQDTVPAMAAPAVERDNPLTRSAAGLIGIVFLSAMILACVSSLPWTLTAPDGASAPRYVAGDANAGRLPPAWWPSDDEQRARRRSLVPEERLAEIAAAHSVSIEDVVQGAHEEAGAEALAEAPNFVLGTDVLGRSLVVRSLTGGGISLGIGIAAALISVLIGTLYGGLSGYIGGKVDAVLMRIVDVLYGLPYILLVVLLAVASEAVVEEQISRSGARERWVERTAEAIRPAIVEDAGAWLKASAQGDEPFRRQLENALAEATGEPPTDMPATGGEAGTRRQAIETAALRAVPPRELSDSTRLLLDVGTLLLAIGGVSWLTMARVIRGQVLSLKSQQFVEAARATGVPPVRLFGRHLLPNLLGPIIVYATLTVPQAILQESFLSFLGIGVKPPLPSWGNLAADGLAELNTYRSNWWLLLFPCVFLGLTLLALNFVGEGLREAFDPKRARR